MSYAGHHPVHAGLQNESVGDIYPLAIVGYGKGEVTKYVIENLVTGQCLGHAHGRGPKVWASPSRARAYLDKLHPLPNVQSVWEFKRPVYDGYVLVWPDDTVGTVRFTVTTKRCHVPGYAIPPRPLTPREAYYAAAEQDIG